MPAAIFTTLLNTVPPCRTGEYRCLRPSLQSIRIMRAIWVQRRTSFRRSKGDGTGDSSHGSGGGVCVGGKGDADKSGYSDDNAEFKMSGRQRRKAQNAVMLIRNWGMGIYTFPCNNYKLSTRRKLCSSIVYVRTYSPQNLMITWRK